MANLKDIKRRIGSVKSTQKITNAMKLVSAAKFARASHAIQAARPYGQAFNEMVGNLLQADTDSMSSPLLRKNPEKKVLLLLIGTDRGLCGGLNSNNFKKAAAWVREKRSQGIAVETVCWGRRAISFGQKEKLTMVRKVEKVLEKPSYDMARATAEEFMQWFVAEKYDAIYVCFPKFQSALAQVPQLNRLLPIAAEDLTAKKKTTTTTDFIVEPRVEELLDLLLVRKITLSIYHALLDGSASEHGARMTAMDSATKNAKEVIKKLTLAYNRARQAAITTELTEIISGAESLN